MTLRTDGSLLTPAQIEKNLAMMLEKRGIETDYCHDGTGYVDRSGVKPDQALPGLATEGLPSNK